MRRKWAWGRWEAGGLCWRGEQERGGAKGEGCIGGRRNGWDGGDGAGGGRSGQERGRRGYGEGGIWGEIVFDIVRTVCYT